jgi:hypothetical protein
MHWGSWTSQMVNLINFQTNWFSDVMADHFKVRMIQPLEYVAFATCVKVIQANNFVSLTYQSINQMGTNKPSTARHQNSHSFPVLYRYLQS